MTNEIGISAEESFIYSSRDDLIYGKDENQKALVKCLVLASNSSTIYMLQRDYLFSCFKTTLSPTEFILVQ